jgi:hypothetical protein
VSSSPRLADVLVVRDGRLEVLPVTVRYVWPSELDLMAQLAGLELEARFGNWAREPFTAASTSHVSVYRKLG